MRFACGFPHPDTRISICIAFSCPPPVIIIITMFHYNDRYRARKILVESSFTVWTWISLSNIQVRAVDKGEEVKWIQQGDAVGRGLVCNIAAAIDTSIPWLKWNQPTPLALHGIAPQLRRSAATLTRLCVRTVPFRLCVCAHRCGRPKDDRTHLREDRLRLSVQKSRT